MQITPDIINSIVIKNGKYFLPDRVRIAIEHCLDSNDEQAITSEYRRLFAEYQHYETLYEPAKIDYRGAITLDAYVSYYFTRNFIIPLIGLRDLAYCETFQKVPESLRILDMGSGTGAVVFGLLWLFDCFPSSKVQKNIVAVDACAEALERQKQMIADAGWNREQIAQIVADISDAGNCIQVLSEAGPYNLIFFANSLTEIPAANTFDLIQRLPDILTDEGAIIIAEAQRNYTKNLVKTIAKLAQGWGLHVYYPCSGDSCPYSFPPYCWVWRYHPYKIPDIKVEGQLLSEDPKGELVASWIILTKHPLSIFDTFKERLPDLTWGSISKETGNKRAICAGNRELSFEDNHFYPVYRRGHIAGLSSDGEHVEHHKI